MSLFESLKNNRTIRRFDKSRSVSDADLEYFIKCASLTASAGNLQRLRYVTVSGKTAEQTFSAVALGGYLPQEQKPTKEVAPTAYIVLATELEAPDANLMIDAGIAAEAITLAASERGIGACMIRNFNKEYFSRLLTEKFPYPVLVIALGYPIEKAKTVDAVIGDSLKYFKNDEGVNVVPKLTLRDLIAKKHN